MADAERTWRELEAPVRGYLRRRLGGDDALADDLAQEVFLRLHRALPTLADHDRVGPWVMRIARSVLVDHLRRRREQGLGELDPAIDEDETPSAREDLGLFLRHVLDRLDEPHRAAVTLVDVDGLTGPEAAERLGIGLPALKARVRRGRERLREELARCCRVVLDGHGLPADDQRHGGCYGCGPADGCG